MKSFAFTIFGLCVLNCAFAREDLSKAFGDVPIDIPLFSPDSTTTEPTGSGKLVEPAKPSPLPQIESKLHYLLFELINGVETKLSTELDRGVVSLTTIHSLGLHIHAHPFTAEENEKLKPFREYMSMVYDLREKLNSQVKLFSNSRFFEYSGFPDHHLLEKQRENLIALIDETVKGVEAASKSIDDVLFNEETQRLIKKIEDGRDEVTTQVRRLTLALTAIDSKLIDEDKLLSVKNETVEKVNAASKGLIDHIGSPVMTKLIIDLFEQTTNIIVLMKDLPLKVDLSYMD